ncbi:MAG: DUF1501 domain-containing protein [Planctomycetota bacterium]|jgi:hypothetical protein
MIPPQENELEQALEARLRQLGRRSLLRGAGLGLASLALGRIGRAQEPADAGGLHHAPRAKRVVHLFQSGGPSQLDLFDHKPLLQERNGEELPDSVRRGQRLTGMSGNQATLPLAGSQFEFARHGESQAWISELLPHTAGIVDRLCIVRTLVTDAINHDPAATFLLSGSQIAGRPSMGAWLSYGLGSLNADLPEFCVLVTRNKGGQPLYKRLWGSGFLSARHQGVQLRAGSDPVLFLNDPAGIDRATRRRMLDALRTLHEDDAARSGDAGTLHRIAQAELAFRMQASVPEVADLSSEPDSTFLLYGDAARTPGTYAANCVLARRLIERDVRFVQLFHQGWDQHGALPRDLRRQCEETDRASAALVTDLARRGLLDETLVVWGGEFGRTCYSQGKLTANDYGRDHHPRCASMWLAGGGVRPQVHGETDDFGYNVTRDPVHVHDLQATLLHLLGIDHERLTYRHQGRRYRLTDVHGRVVEPLIA